MGTIKIIETDSNKKIFEKINLIEEKADYSHDIIHKRKPSKFTNAVLIGAFSIFCTQTTNANPELNFQKGSVNINTLQKYDDNLDESLSISSIIDKTEQVQTNLIDNSLDIISTSNELFANSKPLTGDALQHLSDYFDKTAKKEPTLPNRL